MAWGDYDDDGDLDILVTGYSVATTVARVYRNDGGGLFTDAVAGLPGVWYSSAAWGDGDADGDLDILLTGRHTGEDYNARLFRNDGPSDGTPQPAPSGLTASLSGDRLTLGWSGPTQILASAAAKSYNLRIGTTPGGSEVMSAMAHPVSGFRRIVAMGNAQQRTSWTVTLSQPGVYYWSVQSLNAAFAGPRFAPEQSFGYLVAVEAGAPVELSFALAGANPATGEARFRVGLPTAAHVEISIHDVAGRRVAQLADGTLPAGYHSLSWERRDAVTGLYFARFAAGGQVITRRLARLR